MSEVRTVVGVGDLPPEVLLHIFSFLDVEALWCAVRRVCVQWNQLARHGFLYRHVVLDAHVIPTIQAVELLHVAGRQLKSLSILKRADVIELLRKVSGRNFGLETLIIKKSRGTYHTHSISQELLRRVIKHCPDLRTLTVKNTLGLSHYVFKELRVAYKIRSLNFGVHPEFRAGDLDTIADSCTHLEEFRVFSVDSHVHDLEVARFCTKMADSLRVLKISAKEISDVAVFSVVRCTSLTTLHMRLAKKLTDTSVEMISALTCLTSLDLMQAWNISVDAWVKFFGGTNMKNLQVIGLSLCTHVDDDVLASIADNCKHLRKLRLFGCTEVTVSGLNKIFVACKELKVINVVKVDGVSKSFPCIVSHCPGLEVLIYGPVSLLNEDFDCMNFLKRSLPKLQLIDVSLHRAVTNYDSYLRCFR